MNTHNQQFLRYCVVGVVSNLFLYAFYHVLVEQGLDHKLAMSGLYAFGVMQTFVFNKRWSFRYQGATGRVLHRYFAAYVFAYVLNLCVMLALVDWLGYSHRIVQMVMIFIVALLLFVVQKYWVFQAESSKTHSYTA